MVNTAVTVPQVYITTGNSPIGASSAPSAGLAAGSPSPVAAVPTSTAAAAAGGAGGYGAVGATGYGTTFASVKQVPTAVSSPIAFQGAAAKVGSGGVAGLLVAGVMGLVVLA